MVIRLRGTVGEALERFSRRVTEFAGSTPAFFIALATILAWLVTGPVFRWSDTWQLVINTGTTIVTFLMVFLIQRSQNKDSHAVHLKLNEIVASLAGASNRLIDVEDLSEKELAILARFYRQLSLKAKAEGSLLKSHTVEEEEEADGEADLLPPPDDRRKGA